MKTIACKDAGMDCDFIATGTTDEEVMGKAMEHLESVHSDKLADMAKTMTPEQINDMAKGLIKDA